MNQTATTKKAPNGTGSERSGEIAAAARLVTAIEALAFRLYEQRGRLDGHDVDDWLEAEQQVTDSMRSRGLS